MKYSDAKQQIESISLEYNAYIDFDGDFVICYEGELFACVRSSEYRFDVFDGFRLLPSSDKVYMILAELSMTPVESRENQQKFYVRAFGGYLNIAGTMAVFIANNEEIADTKTTFTKKEIENLKQRKDVPLDWSKVVLERVQGV